MTDKNKKKKPGKEDQHQKSKDKAQPPMANNAAKLVNSSRSKHPTDLEVKNKVTGADFEGPVY